MHSRTGQQASYGLQVYTHHFVTVDTLMVPPPTGQGLMVRPAFTEQHRLLVPANMLESEISRYHHCTKSGIFVQLHLTCFLLVHGQEEACTTTQAIRSPDITADCALTLQLRSSQCKQHHARTSDGLRHTAHFGDAPKLWKQYYAIYVMCQQTFMLLVHVQDSQHPPDQHIRRRGCSLMYRVSLSA